MSLDIYLDKKGTITWADGTTEEHAVEVFSRNITHNLTDMAEAAGIYKALWRPEELDIDTAEDLIPLLELGLHTLKESPDHYKTFDAPNGWGIYTHFVPFVEAFLTACKQHPKSTISISR